MDLELIPDTELRRKAEADCRAAVRAVSAAEVQIDTAQTSTEWDAEDLRHVFEFNAELWLDGFGFEVVLDGAGRAVGYVDESKWRLCEWKPLSREKIVPLAAQAGFVTPTAIVTQHGPGERGALEALLLANPDAPGSRKYRVVINPVLEKIISILPEDVHL